MFHIVFQFFIDPLLFCHREITQMYAFRSIFIDRSYQILIDIFCHKRNHRSSYFGNCDKCGIQSHISINFILLHAFCPETLTASSDIPVTHIIHKFLKSSCSFRNPVIFKIVVHCLNHSIQLGQQPFIHNRQLIIFQCILGCIKFINICIQHEERIGVPQCAHKFSLTFLHCFSMETVRQPRCTVDVEIPADRICSVSFQSLKRVNCISFGFTHFLSVFILYMTQNDNIFIRSFIKQQCRLCQQGIEPSTCLVYCLRNKLCRELLLKQFFILKWIMVLCKWHCS